MEKEKTNNKPQHLLERVFRITRKKNEIDLTGSVAIVNGEVSEELFQNEIYHVTFCTRKENHKKFYSLFLSPSECIPQQEIENLKSTLGITISGDGSLFKVENFISDFKISFDLKNSISIDNLGIKKGVIVFKKDCTTRNMVKIPFRKRREEKTILKR